MTSLSGRVGSATLLRMRRKKSMFHPSLHRTATKMSMRSQNVNCTEEETRAEAGEKVATAVVEKNEEALKFLTPQLLEKLNQEQKSKLKKLDIKLSKKGNNSQKEKLIDGEIVYDNDDDLGEDEELTEIIYKGKDYTLEEGNIFPARYGKVKKDILHKPLVELDPYICLMEETFIIISKRFTKLYIQRYSSKNSLFLLSPFNRLRQACMFLTTWQIFDFFMILTILVNCVIMAIPLDTSNSNITEYVFITIYTIELIVKVIARGFIIDKYSYLRDPWNWLDFVVIIISYVTILLSLVSSNNSVNLSALRAFRVFRAFKTVNVITGLKTLVSAILKSLNMLLEVLLLMIIMLFIFSASTLQVYRGSFSQKCVLSYQTNSSLSYTDWINSETNWLYDSDDGSYVLCSNGTGSNSGRTCNSGYVCLKNIGQNPANGLLSFDNFGWCLLLNFQLFNLDHFEDLYNKIIDSNGAWNFLFFLPSVFIGSYYLFNLLLAVVVLAYEQEATASKKRLESPPQPKKNALVYDLETLKEKIANKAKELEEKKKKKQKKDDRNRDGNKRSKEHDDENSKKIKPEFSDHANSIKDGVSELRICVNLDESSNVTTIQLSQEMGKLDVMIQEGSSTTHLNENELLIDNRNCFCCLKFGQTYLNWVKFQDKIRRIVTSLYFELLIMLCIILNTIIMAIQHNGQPQIIDDLEDYFNYTISGVFIIECLMKIIAFGRLYFYKPGNWFDLSIIILSIVDFALPQVQGLSVFRTFRLLGIFKLAKTWKTMRRILSIVLNTVSALGYLSIILLLIVYIFSVVGNDLLSDGYLTYYTSTDMPRSNFSDILHSFLAIFRILCGEYSEPLRECWLAAGPVCTAVYFPTIFCGNFIVLNLYLALLLDAFDADTFQKEEDDPDDEFQIQMKQLIASIKEFFHKIKIKFRKKENAILPADDSTLTIRAHEEDNSFSEFDKSLKSIKSFKTENSLKGKLDREWKKQFRKKSIQLQLEDCLPAFFYRTLCKCATKTNVVQQVWSKFRMYCLRISENKIFEAFIIIVILTSSTCLAFDDIYLKNSSDESNILIYLNYAFQVIFMIEMLIKWFGYGLKHYFTDWWCLLDCAVVIVGIVDLYFSATGNTNISFLKVLRTFRGLRPLKAISQWEGMRIVVNALASSIPAIFNVFVVCFMFWLIFSIMGVALFKGKFYKCVDKVTGARLSTVSNKTGCLLRNDTLWYNSKINFDNIANGYLALFQIATFEGWQEIIADGVDSIDVDIQPTREASLWVYLYFVAFVIFGAFFTLNLFIGVIIDNFNILKKQYEGGFLDMLLTPSQLAYYHTMKKITQVKPRRAIKRPNNKLQAFVNDMVDSKYFETAVLIIISLNVVVLCAEYHEEPDSYAEILNLINSIFVTIYGVEMMLKLIGLRCYFFRNGWNVFDLMVTVIALINEGLEIYTQRYLVKPSLVRVVRIFRITRILYFLKVVRGVRKLLIAFLVSLPGLFNIVALSFLIIYIYAIIGMNFFMNVKLQNSLTPMMNFQTFFKSFMLLFRLSTAAGWDGILTALMLSSTDPGLACDDNYDLQSLPSSVDPNTANGCGNATSAIIFMVSYVFIMKLVMMNMFVAIIFDNYNETHRQEEIGITNDHIEGFYAKWQKYDPHATQFINLRDLSDFVAELGQPLGVEKPNEMAVTSFDLPIIKDDRIHCLDILHGLIRYALDNVDDNEDFLELQRHIDKTFLYHFPIRITYQPVTTTIVRKKREIAARTLQRAWKKYKLQKTLREHIGHRKKTMSISNNVRENTPESIL